ncbi:MAG: NAD(P)-dependent oxidoreductase [Betaproteobacteria bacterium]|nr:NAD(P)-dependent oxidoreductase [Betaproteobacteria bacterium]
MKRSVGLLGLGIMGSAMAGNLLRAGFSVIGYDPVAACRAHHRKAGGIVAKTAGDVAGSANIVIASLPSAKALLEVADQIAKAGRTRQIVIETSTLPILVKEAARKRLAGAGITLLDCPLSGTGAQARIKDLIVYASGDRTAFKKTNPVLKGFSRGHYYVGRFGNGSKMKYAANLLVAIHNISTAEAVILARRSGLDPALAVKVLGDGAGSSRMLQVRGPLMVRRSYLPATVTNDIWRKDMQIIGEFVRRLKSPAPLFNATKAIYRAALARGYGKADTAAVCAVLERQARKLKRSMRK